MAGPAATPGVFILFDNCNEHTDPPDVNSIKMFEGRVSSFILPSKLAAKCSHIHCLGCGCIKSRTECVYKEPDKTEKFREAWGGSTAPEGNMLDQLDRNEPYDYTKVEATGPLVIEFKLRWNAYEFTDCWIEGVLPTKMASKIIEIVNSPLI